MPPPPTIGIDMGGTRTRVGVVDDQHCIVAKLGFPTPASSGRSALARQLSACLGALSSRVSGGLPADAPVGIAVPGLVDPTSGVVTRSVNLSFLEGGSAHDILPEARVGSVRLMTDIEAATRAEYRACEAPVSRFVHLRVGTGVGCGMMVEGSYLQPPRAAPGHADVLIVDDRPGAPSCPCGRRGCLEVFVSGRALSHRIKSKTGTPVSTGPGDYSPFEPTPRGERMILDQAADWLCRALVRIVKSFEPSDICLGGGLIRAWPALVRTANEEAKHNPSWSALRDTPIRLALLGDDAGIIGATLRAVPRD